MTEIPTVDSRNLPNSWRIADEIKNIKRGLPFRFPYVGSFSQQIAEWFVRTYSNEGDTILDPFSGRGTVAMQSLWHGRNMICNDMSPFSNTLCHSVLYTPRMQDVIIFIDLLHDMIRNNRYEICTEYFGMGGKDDIRSLYHPNTFEDIVLIRNYLGSNSVLMGKSFPEFKEFSAKYVHEIVMFTRMIMTQLILNSNDNISFNGLKIRGSDNTTVRSLEKFYEKLGQEPKEVDIFHNMKQYVKNMNFDNLEIRDKFNNLDRTIINCDARHLTIHDNTVDCVITSPPYFDVLNYGMANWAKLWVLDNLTDPLISICLPEVIQKSSGIQESSDDIGKNYDKLTDITGSTVANPGRYSAFTGEYLRELYRVMKDDSVAVIVVGDYGNKGKIDAWRLVADRAKIMGFEPKLVIMDLLNKSQKSSSQFMQKHGGGKNDYDVIVILYKGNYKIKNNPADINFMWKSKFVDPKQRDMTNAWGVV